LHRRLFVLFGLALPLLSQMPEAWSVNRPLGADLAQPGPWYGAGTWAAGSQGKLGTFVNSLGMGNALQGFGVHLEGGTHIGNWDMAMQAMAIRDPEGQSYLSIYRGHITHTSPKGWIASLEQEPLVWGYGLNGGYLLGEAARPFPRFRVESPMKPLQWGRLYFGTWGFQAFMGRLEKDRVLSATVQDPSYRRTLVANDPSAPLFNGYRAQAEFGDAVEFYMNYTNLWGGTRQGVGMTDGYGFMDYLTSMFGLKDQLAESSVYYFDPNHPPAEYKNKARSSSNMDVGTRVRLRFLEKALGASAVHTYVSRGSKNYTWPTGVFIHKPLYYLGKDLEKDIKDLSRSQFGLFWNQSQRVSVPTLAAPNDTVGMLVAWPTMRLGLEYSDITNVANNPTSGIRAFVSADYPMGFYSYGDPLGNAMGGEAQTTTLRLDIDPIQNVSTSTWVHIGHRPFRDTLSYWVADHPGATFAKNRFFGVQQTVTWKVRPATTVSFGTSWERQSAVEQVAGRQGNTFRWFVDLGHRWSKP
jgi:Capsule assembly protein Wzi